MRSAWVAMPLLLLLLGCGQEGAQVSVESEGSLLVDGIALPLGRARATLLNSPNPVHWAGVPMPAILKVDIYTERDIPSSAVGEATGQPALSFMVGAGPDGDFYNGRWVFPDALQLIAQGIKTYPTREALPACRVRLTGNPFLENEINYEVEFCFTKGDTEYESSCNGMVMVFSSKEYDPEDLPSYPPRALPDTFSFHLAEDTLVPTQFIAVEDRTEKVDVYSVFAFIEPFDISNADPRKSGQSHLRFRLPERMAHGQPVQTDVSATVYSDSDSVSAYASPVFGYVEAVRKGGTLEGVLNFQNNGSASATRFYGGGTFKALIK